MQTRIVYGLKLQFLHIDLNMCDLTHSESSACLFNVWPTALLIVHQI
jgi:hypothetical protein